MTVTNPSGFLAAGVACGLKSHGKKDLALIQNIGPKPSSAVVYTSNRAKANPILWSVRAHEQRQARAVVLNSGGANCFTGEAGYRVSEQTAQHAATVLGLDPLEIQVCSTGMIGDMISIENLRTGIDSAFEELSAEGGFSAAEAIMTTDTVSKNATRVGDGYQIGGIAKGAGMLAPGLATMLVVITTDAVVPAKELERVLKFSVEQSFNRLDSDGCMSTNDQITFMASGSSGVMPDLVEFEQLVTSLCRDLVAQLQTDAEGATHDIMIRVHNAISDSDALEVARSVARNNLFKAAVFGNDPNWGRILAAIGTTQAEFDPYQVDVSINGVRVCKDGGPDRPRTDVDMTPRKTDILIDLKSGGAEELTLWTNDLTHAYVEENSAYSS